MRFFFANNYPDNTYIEDLIPKNEFFWVLSWIKKVGVKDISKISFWDTFTMRMRLQNLIPFFKLYNMHLAITHFEAPSFWSQKNSLLVYWKNKDEVMTIATQISRFDGRWIGEYLGYPNCCIQSRMDMETFLTVYQRTKTFSYLLNDISSYESIPEYLLEKEYNYEFTRLFQYFSGAFLTWTPCSYDCSESIERLKIQEKLIQREDNEYYQFILKRSKKLVIYFNKSNWVSLDWFKENSFDTLRIYEGVFSDIFKGNIFSESSFYIFEKDTLILFSSEKKELLSFTQNIDFFILNFCS